MKTADGVEFTEGMRLFLDDGEELIGYTVDGVFVHYDWVMPEDECGPAVTNTSGAHINSLYASLESLQAFHASKQHECMCCGVMLRQCHGANHGNLTTIPAHVGLVFRTTAAACLTQWIRKNYNATSATIASRRDLIVSLTFQPTDHQECSGSHDESRTCQEATRQTRPSDLRGCVVECPLQTEHQETVGAVRRILQARP
jgi:hypothetical protein